MQVQELAICVPSQNNKTKTTKALSEQLDMRRSVFSLAKGVPAAFSYAGSSAAPLAAVSGYSSCLPSATASSLPSPSSNSPVSQARSFWTSPCSLSGRLSTTLEEEYNYEVENRQKPEAVAQGPPAPFTLKEAPGDTLLTLNRTFGSEKVSVILHVNNQPGAELGEEAEPEEEEDSLSTVVFNTQITKGPNALVFECETDGTFVAINHISYEPAEGHEGPSMYTGPVFDELDEGLQREFQAYLEERGITPALGEYLRHLVHDKEETEYIAWLEKVQKFVA